MEPALKAFLLALAISMLFGVWLGYGIGYWQGWKAARRIWERVAKAASYR